MVVRSVRVVVAAAVLAVLAVGTVPTAAGAGGGDQLYPARDRYEPGQTVTMVGYGFVMEGAQPDWRHTDYHAFLGRWVPDTTGDADGDELGRPGLPLGPVTVEEVEPHWGRNVRVSLEFPLPDDLAPGTYSIDVCTATCDARLGWFITSELHVGVDPASPVVREWPVSDPAIRWLDDEARLGTEQGVVTAADVRAGRVRAPAVPAPAPAAPGTGVPQRSAATEPAGRSGTGSPAAAPGSEGAGVAEDVAAGDAAESAADDTAGGWLLAGGAALALAAAVAPWLVAAPGRSRARGRGPSGSAPALSWDDDAPLPPTDAGDADDRRQPVRL